MTTIRYRYFFVGLYVLSCVSPWQLLHGQTVDGAPSSRAREVLKSGAANSDPNTRRDVAVALSVVGRGDAVTELLPTLAKDKDALVREAAIVSIGELKEARLSQAAKDALEDDVPEVAFAAARTLFALKQPEGEQLLIEVVEKEAKAKSGFVRLKFRDVMRRMKVPRTAILFVAGQGVGFIPVPGVGEGFSALSSLVADSEFSARASALLVLSADRSSNVTKLIEEAFNDDDWSMRAAAIQIAGTRNQRQWRPRLISLFEDTSPKVRYRAAATYLRLERSSLPPEGARSNGSVPGVKQTGR
jgi:HEAT repeat protein